MFTLVVRILERLGCICQIGTILILMIKTATFLDAAPTVYAHTCRNDCMQVERENPRF